MTSYRLSPRGNARFLSIQQSALFTIAECDRIVGMCNTQWESAGVTGYGTDRTDAIRPDVRSTLTQALPVDEVGWPLVALAAEVARLNAEIYRFALDGFVTHDPPSILRYESSVADHFHPHRDMGPDFLTRKLSCVVQLSDPADYRGGSLLFPEHNEVATTGRGTMTVFPSFMVHQVTPVIAGNRSVLVGWAHGPTFS